tara:strand:+ start:1210 stop:1956 length:747 start_codon:yes stop_codon:yes gene_type:complete
MALIDATAIQRFNEEAANLFATKFPFKVKRVSLPIVNGTSTYALSNEVLSIRRITWKGSKVDPLPHRLMRDLELNQTLKSSLPEYYVFNNLSFPSLRFFLIPNTTIAAAVGSEDLYGSAISTRVIVEYYTLPSEFGSRDTAAGVDRHTTASVIRVLAGTHEGLPDYLHQRMIDVYTKMRRAQIESREQDTSAEEYFQSRWDFLVVWADDILKSLLRSPMRYRDGSSDRQRNKIPTPRLPSTFGVSVTR